MLVSNHHCRSRIKLKIRNVLELLGSTCMSCISGITWEGWAKSKHMKNY